LAGKSLSTQNNNSQIDSSTQTPIVEANDSNSPSNYKAVTTVTPEIASPGQKVVIETKVTSEIAQQATVFLGINNPKLTDIVHLSGDEDPVGTTIDFQPGKTYTYQVTYTVPQDAAEGTYKVKEAITSPDNFHDYFYRPAIASFQIENSN
jgi:hypothetical protein